MNMLRRLRGIELRYVLTIILLQQGPATVAELVEILGRDGFSVAGRPSKSVSDALRWERRRCRVRRLGRGRYEVGEIPRGTAHRMRKQVTQLRAQADSLSRQAGQPDSARRMTA